MGPAASLSYGSQEESASLGPEVQLQNVPLMAMLQVRKDCLVAEQHFKFNCQAAGADLSECACLACMRLSTAKMNNNTFN